MSSKTKSDRVARKVIIGSFIALILLIIIIATTNSKPPKTTKSSSSASTSSSASSSAPAAKPAVRQVEGKATTLGAGTFTGGKDVAVGLYDVTAPAGQSGNFIVNGGGSYNEVLGGDQTLSEVPKIRVNISSGDQIQISGLSSVIFTPVSSPFVTTHTMVNLYAGTFTVGQDVGAGRYVVKPGAGQSGNFIVNGGESYNEVLGSDASLDEVPSLTVNLSTGDSIEISGLSRVNFTPTD